MTDNLAALFATEPPDGTTLVAWTDGVPDVVWRDDNEAVLSAAPDGEWWWSNTKSVRPMTLAKVLEGAERVAVAVPPEYSGLALANRDAVRAWGEALINLPCRRCKETIREGEKVAILATYPTTTVCEGCVK